MQSKDGIIARLVESAEAARTAAAEGANLILLKVGCHTVGDSTEFSTLAATL